MMAKRDFGSFHASNVQELLNLPEDSYAAPTIPVDTPKFDQDNPIEFGKKMKEKHFFLGGEFTFLNHGAFGCVLKDALLMAQQWQIQSESQPLRFYDREILPQLVHVTRRLGRFVGCAPQDLILMTNVTTAINTIVQSQDWKPGDVVYTLNIAYGATKKLLNHLSKERKISIQEETINFPVKDKQQVITLVEQTLKPGTTLAIFDHIPSNTPIVLPIKEMIDICHARGVPVLVDGAHSLGSLDLDLESLGADYYVSNCHKWFCGLKGSAFMYVRKELQPKIRPLVVSHGFGSGLHSQFMWTGLQDYFPFLALNTVLDFWEACGPSNIRHYIHGLAKDASQNLKSMWQSQLAAPQDMFGSMVLVQLPRRLYENCDTVDYSKAEVVQNALYHRFQIEVPIKCIQGHLYVRISAHIYNELSEYEELASAILTLTKEKLLG